MLCSLFVVYRLQCGRVSLEFNVEVPLSKRYFVLCIKCLHGFLAFTRVRISIGAQHSNAINSITGRSFVYNSYDALMTKEHYCCMTSHIERTRNSFKHDYILLNICLNMFLSPLLATPRGKITSLKPRISLCSRATKLTLITFEQDFIYYRMFLSSRLATSRGSWLYLLINQCIVEC